MISIVGAGPVGNYLAYLLARKGHKVRVFEEHSKIGSPIQCTGITTGNLLDLIKLDDFCVVNKINRISVYSPNGRRLEFRFRRKNIIINRTRFDKYFSEMAKSEGTKYFLNHKFKRSNHNGKGLFFEKGKRYTTDYLVGADGPHSNVAKSNNLFGNRRFIYGIQAVVKREFDPELVETFMGYGGFGWIVPENEKFARVGITAMTNPSNEFRRFLREIVGKHKFIGWQSGLIPVYDPRLRTRKGRVLLVGDAATQVKALTHGGIIPGLIAAQEMSRSFENYEHNWKRRMGGDLWLNLFLKEVMNNFSDEDYNLLVNLFSQKRLKKIVEKYDRDFPTKYSVQLALKEPRLFFFAKHFLKAYFAL